jgi:hypothetical protein
MTRCWTLVCEGLMRSWKLESLMAEQSEGNEGANDSVTVYIYNSTLQEWQSKINNPQMTQNPRQSSRHNNGKVWTPLHGTRGSEWIVSDRSSRLVFHCRIGTVTNCDPKTGTFAFLVRFPCFHTHIRSCKYIQKDANTYKQTNMHAYIHLQTYIHSFVSLMALKESQWDFQSKVIKSSKQNDGRAMEW